MWKVIYGQRLYPQYVEFLKYCQNGITLDELSQIMRRATALNRARSLRPNEFIAFNMWSVSHNKPSKNAICGRLDYEFITTEKGKEAIKLFEGS